MDSRDLAAVWTVLESSPPGTGIEAVRIGHEVAAGDLLAGIDGKGCRYLLIPLLPGEAARVDTKGRAVHLIRVQHAESHYLAVVCVYHELYAVFTQFSRELIASVADAGSPARAAVEVFERWKALFSESAQRDLISEDRLIGLLGELLTLEALLDEDAPTDLRYWRGPFGESQDFRTANVAMEVKTTLARDGRIIGISSIDQLQQPPDVALCLIHHRLERDPRGFNIADIAQRLISLGASMDSLATGLAGNGVALEDLESYGAQRFRRVETRTYDASISYFPRITRASFIGGDIPPGTIKLSYSIDLTNEPPHPLDANDTVRFFQMMAMDT